MTMSWFMFALVAFGAFIVSPAPESFVRGDVIGR